LISTSGSLESERVFPRPDDNLSPRRYGQCGYNIAPMLRSILVPLDGSIHSATAVDLAIGWGLQFGARLVGVGIIDEPTILRAEPVPLGAFSYKEARDKSRLENARSRVRQFLSAFEAQCRKSGVTAGLVETVGDPADRILREAQRCDLVMIGRGTNFHFETQDYPDKTMAAILRGSARPVVVVPPEPAAGHGVMVAYGGGREVARALQTFQLLGLAAGETVHLVSVQREGWEASDLAGLAADFLAAHGTPHDLQELTSDQSPAEALLAHLHTLRPRLLVMGAQGHHPVRDLFVSSVTRAVLMESPVPTFIAA
jgi:nucleotide-binding universal stress UspA family protein